MGDDVRSFLKIDAQGYDSQVFAGLGEMLNRVVAMQSEVSLVPIYQGMPRWTDSISEYENAGFGVAGLYPIAWTGLRIMECDCLLVKGAVMVANGLSQVKSCDV